MGFTQPPSHVTCTSRGASSALSSASAYVIENVTDSSSAVTYGLSAVTPTTRSEAICEGCPPSPPPQQGAPTQSAESPASSARRALRRPDNTVRPRIRSLLGGRSSGGWVTP